MVFEYYIAKNKGQALAAEEDALRDLGCDLTDCGVPGSSPSPPARERVGPNVQVREVGGVTIFDVGGTFCKETCTIVGHRMEQLGVYKRKILVNLSGATVRDEVGVACLLQIHAWGPATGVRVKFILSRQIADMVEKMNLL